MDGCAQPRQLLHATCNLLSLYQTEGALVQARPSVQQLLQLPYVARYVECYVQQMLQLADAQGQAGLQGGLLPFQPGARWGPLNCHLELLFDMRGLSMTCSTPLPIPCCQHAPDLQYNMVSLVVAVLLDVDQATTEGRVHDVYLLCRPQATLMVKGCSVALQPAGASAADAATTDLRGPPGESPAVEGGSSDEGAAEQDQKTVAGPK